MDYYIIVHGLRLLKNCAISMIQWKVLLILSEPGREILSYFGEIVTSAVWGWNFLDALDAPKTSPWTYMDFVVSVW